MQFWIENDIAKDSGSLLKMVDEIGNEAQAKGITPVWARQFLTAYILVYMVRMTIFGELK